MVSLVKPPLKLIPLLFNVTKILKNNLPDLAPVLGRKIKGVSLFKINIFLCPTSIDDFVKTREKPVLSFRA